MSDAFHYTVTEDLLFTYCVCKICHDRHI